MLFFCSASNTGNEDAVVLPMVSRFHNLLAFGVELLTGLSNNCCQYNIVTDALQFVSPEGGLVDGWKGAQMERSSQKRDSGGADIAEDWADEIYIELPAPDLSNATAASAAPISPVKGQDSRAIESRSELIFAPLTGTLSAHAPFMLQIILRLLNPPKYICVDEIYKGLYGVRVDAIKEMQMKRPVLAFLNKLLRQLIPTLMSELQQQLQQLDLPALEGHMAFQDQCYERLVITAQALLQRFVDANIVTATAYAMSAQNSVYLSNFDKALSYSPSNDNELSAEVLIAALNNDSNATPLTGDEVAQNVGPTAKAMVDLVHLLDEVAVLGSVLFGDTPPKVRWLCV